MNKLTIVQIGREFYYLKHAHKLSIEGTVGLPNIKKLKRILENYDVRLLKEVSK